MNVYSLNTFICYFLIFSIRSVQSADNTRDWVESDFQDLWTTDETAADHTSVEWTKEDFNELWSNVEPDVNNKLEESSDDDLKKSQSKDESSSSSSSSVGIRRHELIRKSIHYKCEQPQEPTQDENVIKKIVKKEEKLRNRGDQHQWSELRRNPLENHRLYWNGFCTGLWRGVPEMNGYKECYAIFELMYQKSHKHPMQTMSSDGAIRINTRKGHFHDYDTDQNPLNFFADFLLCVCKYDGRYGIRGNTFPYSQRFFYAMKFSANKYFILTPINTAPAARHLLKITDFIEYQAQLTENSPSEWSPDDFDELWSMAEAENQPVEHPQEDFNELAEGSDQKLNQAGSKDKPSSSSGISKQEIIRKDINYEYEEPQEPSEDKNVINQIKIMEVELQKRGIYHPWTELRQNSLDKYRVFWNGFCLGLWPGIPKCDGIKECEAMVEMMMLPHSPHKTMRSDGRVRKTGRRGNIYNHNIDPTTPWQFFADFLLCSCKHDGHLGIIGKTFPHTQRYFYVMKFSETEYFILAPIDTEPGMRHLLKIIDFIKYKSVETGLS